MAGLSRPIVIGNIAHERGQFVIREEKNSLSSEENYAVSNLPNLLCLATLRVSPPHQVTKVLRRPAASRIGFLRNKGFAAFGETHEAWVLETNSRLEEFANSILSALLWRAGVQGGPLRLSANRISLRWSEEEEDFDPLGFLNHQIPGGTFTFSLPESQSLDFTFDEFPKPVGDASYGCPPLGQELLREAWRNLYAHPRSALVVGVAAAETGLKTLIVETVPQNSWLIRELQSPPIEKLAAKYLPTLPARCTLEGEVKPPPKSIMRIVSNGVTSRNAIVHGRGDMPTSDEVRSLLLAVKDLLYLCDYYAGNKWALDLISVDVRKELRLKT